MMIVVASMAVALVAFIVYALDRKAKGEPISWDSAIKLSLFGGIVTAGVVFATTTEQVVQVINTVKESVPDIQDMFVGVPTF
jgi:hypothetical protein